MSASRRHRKLSTNPQSVIQFIRTTPSGIPPKKLTDNSKEAIVFVTLIAIVCSGEFCREQVITDSDHSGLTLTACQMSAQIQLAQWQGEHPQWTVKGYKCHPGQYR